MSEPVVRPRPTDPAEIPTPQTLEARRELAGRLFREFQALCFWHSPHDLEITAERIPFVAKGLRANGGRRGFLLAAKLDPRPILRESPGREPPRMPLTAFQKEVLLVLKANRNPDSHVAGGAVINRADESLRFSDDIDIFHDSAESVAVAAAADERTLADAGYSVVWGTRLGSVHRAVVGRGTDQFRLDWSFDSAFRFFPVQEDEEFGYCLHRADLATNKVLALAGRGEARDYLDILQLDRAYLDLGALMWAACGKDPGLTPAMLIQLTNRHSRYQASDLEAENLARPVDLPQLKRRWLAARERAENLFDRLPQDELGCLYIGPTGEPITPDPDSPEFSGLRRHYGSVRGAWPRIVE